MEAGGRAWTSAAVVQEVELAVFCRVNQGIGIRIRTEARDGAVDDIGRVGVWPRDWMSTSMNSELGWFGRQLRQSR